jgi:hypothetical protein
MNHNFLNSTSGIMHFPIALLSDSIHTGFEGSNDESFSVTKEQKYLS